MFSSLTSGTERTYGYGRGWRKHQMTSPSALGAALTISQPLAPAALALTWTSSAVAASKQK